MRHSGPVLVSGAAGFIGRRTVELLVQHGYQVRALVRHPARPAFDPSVDVFIGDLTKPESYATALSGVWAVVHAALTEDFSQDVRVGSTLEDLSVRAGAQKFIHLSTIRVYGDPPDGIITEESEPCPRDKYSCTKLAIEEALRRSSGVAETVILRLGCVYGPGGGWWTDGLLSLMLKGRLILVDGGAGTANLIHVDDVGAIILLSLARSKPGCEIFNVTDGAPVSWSRYFSHLEAVLGRTATISMNVAEARDYARKWLRPSLPRRVIRKVLGRRYVHPLEEPGIESYASRAVFSNAKAVSALGFKPCFDLDSGIRTITRRQERY